MSIITISRPPCTSGEAVAREVSSRLQYKCVDREVFRDAAERSGMPQAKLESAFTKGPAFLGMSRATRAVCVAHVRAALARCFLHDDVVYYGPFGAHLVQDVSHLLSVRIEANLEDRIALKMKRDSCSRDDAERALLSQDRQRRAVAAALFSAGDDEEGLFDLVINTSTTSVEVAAGLIEETVRQSRFKPTTYSVGRLEAQELASRVKAALIDLDPDVEVRANAGIVEVRMKARGLMRKRRIRTAHERAAQIEGVREAKVQVVEDQFDRIMGSSRLR